MRDIDILRKAAREAGTPYARRKAMHAALYLAERNRLDAEAKNSSVVFVDGFDSYNSSAAFEFWKTPSADPGYRAIAKCPNGHMLIAAGYRAFTMTCMVCQEPLTMLPNPFAETAPTVETLEASRENTQGTDAPNEEKK